MGLGSLALLDLLHRETAGAPEPRPTHFPAKARAIIWLFMTGGP